jgi:hypothetical protein
MLPTVLIMSQVYMPDPAAIGQHLHDAPGIRTTVRGLLEKAGLPTDRAATNPFRSHWGL